MTTKDFDRLLVVARSIVGDGQTADLLTLPTKIRSLGTRIDPAEIALQGYPDAQRRRASSVVTQSRNLFRLCDGGRMYVRDLAQAVRDLHQSLRRFDRALGG